MHTSYTIWLSSPYGERLAVLDRFVRLEYRRIVNRSGRTLAQGSSTLPFQLVLPAAALPVEEVQIDSRLEIWRTQQQPDPAGNTGAALHTQRLDTETFWLVRRVSQRITRDGQRLLEIGAVPAIDLLSTRIVAYASGSPQASKQGPADDLIKQVVRENLSNAASDNSRSLSDWLAVLPDTSLAPVVSKDFARRNVLQVLNELAEASAAAGTPLAFDLVSPNPYRLELRTFIGTRGSDRTFPGGTRPVLLSVESGTLTDVTRSLAYEDEFTAVYVAGQGAESERLVIAATSAGRSDTSPFSRREYVFDARHSADPHVLASEANAALRLGRPRHTFEAAIVSTPGMAYGQHWNWGDRVTAVFADDLIDCTIDEVHVVVEQGREQVRARLRADGSLPPSADERLDRLAAISETEATYQQIQRGSLPGGALVTIPASGQMLVYRQYALAGQLALGAGARLVLLT